MRGNAVVGEAAIKAGCTCYFGYPITPQNQLPEYMSRRLVEVGGVFIQSESEISAINMALGASVAGARVMTSSSSPGISLKQEGISFLAGCELPCVIVNMARGGPGLGNISPAQSDYFQATRGGGHGDYRSLVYAPASCQELADLTMEAFDVADVYRNPVMILADGMIGQMMEPVTYDNYKPREIPPKDYILDGAKDRPSRIIKSLILNPHEMEEFNWKLARKYRIIEKNETKYEEFMMDDAKVAVIAYGTAARIAKGAVKRARNDGMRVGLIRPITLWPFPSEIIYRRAASVGLFFVFEMSAGQMVEDVRLALKGESEIYFYGRPGGIVPTPVEVQRLITRQYYQKGLI
ncbi:MAG: 3-methyl-2-oxobutanoate dehydrogenase subunit VorB [Deltaproteobacteria bacterium]|nr:3-methyl-2-oxobutanoate dehydrogenase subunit VorB [Candidatus Zymogenaceae bacterium]